MHCPVCVPYTYTGPVSPRPSSSSSGGILLCDPVEEDAADTRFLLAAVAPPLSYLWDAAVAAGAPADVSSAIGLSAAAEHPVAHSSAAPSPCSS